MYAVRDTVNQDIVEWQELAETEERYKTGTLTGRHWIRHEELYTPSCCAHRSGVTALAPDSIEGNIPAAAVLIGTGGIRPSNSGVPTIDRRFW